MLQEISFNLEINPGTVKRPVVHLSQYDTGRVLTIQLWNGDSTFSVLSNDVTVRVEGTKPDGHGFSYDDAVTIVSSNKFTITPKEQMVNVAGKTVCEVIIISNDEQIGSSNFILDVESSALADDVDLSSSELAPYMDAAAASAAEAAQLVQRAQSAIANFDEHVFLEEMRFTQTVDSQAQNLADYVYATFMAEYNNEEF